MRPLAEIQAFEMQTAAADDARRTSRPIHTDPTPGYLADVCRALADAEAFCRRGPVLHSNPPVPDADNVRRREPVAHGNPLMEFPTQW